jgi:hypothetical protein
MFEPPPGLLSTMKDCPKIWLSLALTARAVRSVDPPGPKATITLTGRFGYELAASWPNAGKAEAAPSAQPDFNKVLRSI